MTLSNLRNPAKANRLRVVILRFASVRWAFGSSTMLANMSTVIGFFVSTGLQQDLLIPCSIVCTKKEFAGNSSPASEHTQLIAFTASSAADLDSRWIAILCRYSAMCCSLFKNGSLQLTSKVNQLRVLNLLQLNPTD